MIANSVRMLAALMIIALDFTHLIQFIALGGTIPNGNPPTSAFIVEFASYGLCVLILMLDTRSAARLLRKGIFAWAVATVGLFTWGMLVRAFDSPAGIDDYYFLHAFGIQVHYIAFLVSCVFIFDQPNTLALARRAVAVATIAGVVLNIYDLIHPGVFSRQPGRASGLYVNPNGSGMALVLGCIVGLPALRRRWSREAFFLVISVGVLATFSRMAIVSLILVMVVASIAGVWSVTRLFLMICGVMVLLVGLNLARDLREHQIGRIAPGVDFATIFRLYEDSSVQERVDLAQNAVEEFREAPLLGHGFGTTIFWTVGNVSHNYYLSLLTDYGIFGIVLIPALVLSIRRPGWEYYAFAGTLLLFLFFNSELLNDPMGVVCIAIEADEASMLTISRPGRLAGVAGVYSAAQLRRDLSDPYRGQTTGPASILFRE